LRLRLTDDFDEPLSGLSYALWIPGGKTLEGKLGDDGLIDQEIPANIRKLKLILVDMNTSFDLVVGELNPISRVSGVQQRLQNLGYAPGRADNKMGPKTRAALMKFQAAEGLPVTGKADKATRQKLEEVHDGIDRGEDTEDDEGVAINVTASEGDAGADTPLETTLPNYEVNEQGD
jgi:peptidoglycan hydrolase-like protein with peptidoglycan-binding domain